MDVYTRQDAGGRGNKRTGRKPGKALTESNYQEIRDIVKTFFFILRERLTSYLERRAFGFSIYTFEGRDWDCWAFIIVYLQNTLVIVNVNLHKSDTSLLPLTHNYDSVVSCNSYWNNNSYQPLLSFFFLSWFNIAINQCCYPLIDQLFISLRCHDNDSGDIR